MLYIKLFSVTWILSQMSLIAHGKSKSESGELPKTYMDPLVGQPIIDQNLSHALGQTYAQNSELMNHVENHNLMKRSSKRGKNIVFAY
jgi:hypothetical protein